ncbi:DNA-directed RNA polymerase subunit L [Candidatus Woesearchaeota archaeon]|jgi:DNA-directed RNA polymerase subunit L|nr:DNA-directed RNA polymerase subunit L [Candidatus Woesearchaeota archaeon]MBT5272620.1 DNA-directed RNA polymerase subunit L [Candidatus Woesearchaeota archaeon]MBT6041743.1 DNA-directed RNA polymerase subunit L [Candidatus Woesearchaeota archaeon]MBT6337172.1 DNA-directed RNA polymerase subunit L [Candidatus Woesearchaeota archaeon]MBT7927808.1 DNA-directed RNA polymerase subunit L [Candidatus Woesearchaeota archaeon]
MEINVIESSKKTLVVELKGEGHAMCNALKKEIWNDKDTKVGGYHIEHPQVGIPRITVESTGKAPQKILQDACKRLEKKNSDFLAKFKKVVK